MKKALLVIDYTYDFVAADGKLTCGEAGQAIEQYIATQVEQFATAGELVVFLNDVHVENDPYHPETTLFPPHNIINTAGRELYGLVKQAYEAHQPSCMMLDKTRYSAFVGTPLQLLLKERGIHELHLVGVCTDICVLHTAVDGYNAGYDMTIHAQGVASFDADGHAWALRHFKNTLGAKVI